MASAPSAQFPPFAAGWPSPCRHSLLAREDVDSQSVGRRASVPLPLGHVFVSWCCKTTNAPSRQRRPKNNRRAVVASVVRVAGSRNPSTPPPRRLTAPAPHSKSRSDCSGAPSHAVQSLSRAHVTDDRVGWLVGLAGQNEHAVRRLSQPRSRPTRIAPNKC